VNPTGKPEFVYVIYIRTTAEKLWHALTDPELNRQFWFGYAQECGWKAGSPWRMLKPDGSVADSGEVVEIDPPRRLVLSWRNEFRPELHAEGYSRMTWLIEPQGEMVRFTVIHEMDRPQSKFIEAVSQGWPQVLSSLKSLLETGESLRRWQPAA